MLSWQDMLHNIIIYCVMLIASVPFLFMYIKSVLDQGGPSSAATSERESLALIFFYFIFQVIVIPVWEETVYRGMFEKFFFDKPFIIKLIASSLIFLVIHVPNSIYLGCYFFIAGCGLYYAFSRHKNLADSIFIHMLHNFILFIPQFLG
ncbi:hypothetical protein CBF27_06000 [Vagococcus acidifermentans]|uniref:CAAX prenyl protease 2/Lysostaphin resistance protein A-like domain-containing protein n=2 Tax=Vagococcus acidifermentans TaxID=564710 RepID=A0A430AWV4_9ENTE|nr:hypothetical protein CBF27_06000 [Vagococcus acidifermentans]